MKFANVESERKWVCSRCIGDAYLRRLIDSFPKGACSYCDQKAVGRINIETLADKVEVAFGEHYERTETEPEGFESAMHRDRESSYEWEREGDPVKDVITAIVDCSDELAEDIAEILSNKYDSFDPGDVYCDEFEFSAESHYTEKYTSSADWEGRWYQLEHNLKHESRLFNQEVLELFRSVFAGLETACSYQDGGPAIVSAGPGTEISELYRAREFQSAESLKKALQKPVEELGPPPGRNARANRMNSSGISVFYGAKKPGAALAEVRPVVGSTVVVARFTIIRQLQLLDLRILESLGCSGSIFDPDFGAELERHIFLRMLSKRLILPVMPSDQDHAYLITQAVADYLASLQAPSVDGIIFPSVQDGVGVNIVLFHKASLIEQLDFPNGTTFSAEIEEIDYDTGVPYPCFSLQIEKPSKADRKKPPMLWSEERRDLGHPFARPRQPALRLDLESIRVHSVKAVKVKTEAQRVIVGYGINSPKKSSMLTSEDF
ncbi:RES family NAD+ phosphorylase [Pseudomonas sp. LF242]